MCRLYNCYKLTVSIYLLNSLYQLHTSMPNLVKLFIDACYIVFPYIKQFTAREWYYINPHQAYFISLRYLILWERRSTSRSKKPKRCTKGGNLTCFIFQALQLLSWPSSSDSEVRSYEGVLFLLLAKFPPAQVLFVCRWFCSDFFWASCPCALCDLLVLITKIYRSTN